MNEDEVRTTGRAPEQPTAQLQTFMARREAHFLVQQSEIGRLRLEGVTFGTGCEINHREADQEIEDCTEEQPSYQQS
jgi:hypothetical protein